VNDALARALRLQKQASRVDHYAVLEVERDADNATIRRAYRRLALQWHPDKNNQSTVALAKFREVAEAYRVLSDPGMAWCWSRSSRAC
jgi:curved DNA-binding protein CbpA